MSSVATQPRPGLLLALVGIAGALPFIAALGGPFLWDDTHLIENNLRVHTLAHVTRLFTHAYFDTGTGISSHFLTYYRPLSLLSYAMDWTLGRGNPTAFHATNLLLAMLVTWLAADCLVRWTRSLAIALPCALLFAWHPTKVESVAWISGRTDLLVTACMLLACKAHSIRQQRGGAWVGVEFVTSLCAYASKETAILLPLLVTIEGLATTDQKRLGSSRLRSLFGGARWHWLAALGYLVLRSTVFPLVPPVASGDGSTLTNRVGLAFETMGHAAQLLFYPRHLSAEHGLASFDEHGQFIIHGPHVVLGCIFVVALCASAWFARRRARTVALGSALILLTLLPTANLIPTRLQCAFYERFLFLPTLGMALLIAGVMQASIANRAAWRACLMAIAGVLVLFSLRCAARANDFSSAARFWRHEATVNPLSTIAPQGLADADRAIGEVQSAIGQLSRCHAHAVARRQSRTALRCAYDGAILLADSTPDLHRQSLESAERFFAAFVEPDSTRLAQLDLAGHTVSIDTSAAAVQGFTRELSGESLSVLSSIELRLNRARATEHAHMALARCATCLYALRAARVLAAGGQLDEALRTVDTMLRQGPLRSVTEVKMQLTQYAYWSARASATRGPERVHARAQGYLALGLYGAAYAVLQPYAQEFRPIAAMNLQYAQVAYHAGDRVTARVALLRDMDRESADAVLARWDETRHEPWQ